MSDAAKPYAAPARGRSRNVALAALRVGARLAYERMARPMARDGADTPGSPDAITPEWLTATVGKAAPGAAASSVTVEPVSSGTQARHRLRILWNEAGVAAGLPATIFTKSLPTFVTRMVAGFNGQGRVEGRFYMEARPLLDIEAPRCFHSAYDRDAFAAIHLLEDLVATKAATFCGHRTEVTRAMAEDMVDLLAALHARFRGLDATPDRFRWLAPYPVWFTIGAHKMRTEHYTAKAFDAAADIIPARLMARRAEVWPATMRAIAPHARSGQVLLHSDVHIGNWYYTAAGRMGLCDWQCPSRGHWARDVAYALSAALLPEDRRKWERDLLARYIERSGAPEPFEDALALYRGQTLHALAMWTITLCHSRLLPAMQPEDMTREMLRRIATAVDDLDALDAP